MKQRYRYFLSVVTILLGLFLGTSAYACQSVSFEEPERESRLYANTDAGFSFLIPENYRTTRLGSGAVWIFEPSAFAEYLCIVQNNTPTEFPLESVSVYVEPITSPNDSLLSLVFQFMPWMEREGFNFRNGTLTGRPALAFSQENALHGGTTHWVAVMTPDGRNLVILSGGQDGEINRALSSFEFK
jgi:hypothetical protein